MTAPDRPVSVTAISGAAIALRMAEARSVRPVPDDRRVDDDLRAQLEANPEPLMATMTTEHFTLAGARSQTVSEANGRASIFLAAMSSGLIALGFLGPTGTTSEVFALVLLPTLAFLGLVTFDRVLQLSVEDIGYHRRIELCRQFYADSWPMLAPYLFRPRAEEESGGSRRGGGWQLLLTVSGVLAVLTSLLTGAVVALLARILIDVAIGAAFAVGVGVAAGVLALLHHVQRTTFARADFSRIDPQMHRREEDAAHPRRRPRRDPPA